MLQNEAGTKERRGLSKMSKPIQPKPPNFVHVLKNRLNISFSQFLNPLCPRITRGIVSNLATFHFFSLFCDSLARKTLSLSSESIISYLFFICLLFGLLGGFVL